MIGYIYPSKFGTFSIFPDGTGRWRLELGGRYLAIHASAELAANSVFECASGDIDWDAQGSVEAPNGLDQWQATRTKP